LEDPRNYHTHNIFNFRTEQPHLPYDVSLCYDASEMVRLQMNLTKGSLNTTLWQYNRLLVGFVLKMAEVASISPLRINQPQLNFSTEVVSFTLLGRPLEGGEDQPSLQAAREALEDAVAAVEVSFTVVLRVLLGERSVSVSIVRNSTQEVVLPTQQPPLVEQGYTSGDMGGLAVGCMLLGALIAAAALFAHEHVQRGGSLPRPNLPTPNLSSLKFNWREMPFFGSGAKPKEPDMKEFGDYD